MQRWLLYTLYGIERFEPPKVWTHVGPVTSMHISDRQPIGVLELESILYEFCISTRMPQLWEPKE